MSDLRDELAEVIYSNMGRSWGWPKYRDALDSPRADLVAEYGKRDATDAYAYAATAEQAANALLPIITRETERARAESEAKARRFANLLGNQAKYLNDVLPAEVLRQKADAWDEGHKAGCADPYARYGQCDCGPNPYRPEPCPICGGRNGGHSMPCTAEAQS